MPEGYITRIGRLVSASANTLINSLENAAPLMVMEETIREIDQAIEEVRQELGRAEAARYLSSQSLNKDNARHTELQEQIEVAVNAGRDDLAEAAIARQMDIEAMIPVVEKSIVDSDAQILELNSFIQALQAKRREMEEASEEYRKAEAHTEGGNDLHSTNNSSQKVDKATSAFNRVMNVAGAPGISANKDASKLAELEALARTNRIQERLAKVKSEASS
ncbi:hypothetical protein NBRC116188_06500 [Oceaniserpentilla sp. 4NH20-0058]|uniref:PspA/IM30 family protein n=1 Tax=Oceaniserpentilla sp. 4NH20-0058 TaxID=3127660 RepID=UPI00310207A8